MTRDLALTARLKQAGVVLGIEPLDYVRPLRLAHGCAKESASAKEIGGAPLAPESFPEIPNFRSHRIEPCLPRGYPGVVSGHFRALFHPQSTPVPPRRGVAGGLGVASGRRRSLRPAETSAADDLPRQLNGILDLLATLPEKMVGARLEQVIALGRMFKPTPQAHLLTKALAIATCLGSSSARDIAGWVVTLASPLDAKEIAAAIGPQFGSILKSLRRLGLRAYAEDLVTVWKVDDDLDFVTRAGVAGGFAYLGQPDKAAPVIGEAFEALASKELGRRQWEQLSRATAIALAHSPVSDAIAGLGRLSTLFDQVFDDDPAGLGGRFTTEMAEAGNMRLVLCLLCAAIALASCAPPKKTPSADLGGCVPGQPGPCACGPVTCGADQSCYTADLYPRYRCIQLPDQLRSCQDGEQGPCRNPQGGNCTDRQFFSGKLGCVRICGDFNAGPCQCYQQVCMEGEQCHDFGDRDIHCSAPPYACEGQKANCQYGQCPQGMACVMRQGSCGCMESATSTTP